MARPIFLTGLARGGTNLLARMLVAGGECRIAIHAFQPWFKSLRNAIVAQRGSAAIRAVVDPTSPFGDGYFDDVQLAVQCLLRDAMLDVPFVADQWPDLREKLQARAADEATDLLRNLDNLADAGNYRQMMDRILTLILHGHGGAKFFGLIDTWIIDFLPALARAYADARFLVVIRDPRAIVASQLKFMDTEPRQVGHVLSIVRQWRKYVAVGHAFLHDPLFAGRLKLVRYEDEVSEPEQFAKGLSHFLDLPFHSTMIDFAKYKDPASNKQWKGNSAFDVGLQRIDPTVAERWRQTLNPGAHAAIEYCCGLDMRVCGYQPVNSFSGLAEDPRPLAFLTGDGERDCAWRTDTGDTAAEYGFERWRRALFEGSGRPSEDDIRRAFLSVDYFELIRSQGRLFPARG